MTETNHGGELDVSASRIEKSPILALFAEWCAKAADPAHKPESQAEHYFLIYSRKLGSHCADLVVSGHTDPRAIMVEAKKRAELDQAYLMQSLLNRKFSVDEIAFAVFVLESDFERMELPKRIREATM